MWLRGGNGEVEEEWWSKGKNLRKEIIGINVDEGVSNGFQAGRGIFLKS